MRSSITILLLFLAGVLHAQQSRDVGTERRITRRQKAESRKRLAHEEKRQIREEKQKKEAAINEFNTHDIHLGYGTPSLAAIGGHLIYSKRDGNSFGLSTGTAALAYKYYLLPRLAVGISACRV